MILNYDINQQVKRERQHVMELSDTDIKAAITYVLLMSQRTEENTNMPMKMEAAYKRDPNRTVEEQYLQWNQQHVTYFRGKKLKPKDVAVHVSRWTTKSTGCPGLVSGIHVVEGRELKLSSDLYMCVMAICTSNT